ncbi:hypothetical protein ACO0QE_004201 [Hanseniaspora vineae]
MQKMSKYPLYIVINEYNKRMDDELDMKPGDKIQVITDDQEYNDGWYLGRNLRTGFEGLYPKCFTQEISVNNKGPSLVRTKSTRRLISPSLSGSTTSLDSDAQKNQTNMGFVAPQSPHGNFQRNFSAASSNSQHSHGNSPLNNGNNYPAVARENSSSLGIFNGATRRFSRLLSGNSTHSSNDVSPVTALNPANNRKDSQTKESFRNDTINATTSSANARNMMINSTLILRHLQQQQQQQHTSGNDALPNINPADLNPEDCGYWSPQEVAVYFESVGLDKPTCLKLLSHKISGKILLDLEMIHLKQELDIASFGTRYEIFQEIENLKRLWQASGSNGLQRNLSHSVASSNSLNNKKNSFLMPAASVANPVSASTDQLPLPREKSQLTRPLSLALPLDSNNNEILNSSSFVSPRKAPQPPSYPSPVQPPKSPEQSFVKRSSTTLVQKKTPSTANFQNFGSLNGSFTHPYKMKIYESTTNTPSPIQMQQSIKSSETNSSSVSPTTSESANENNASSRLTAQTSAQHTGNNFRTNTDPVLKTHRSHSTISSSNPHGNSHKRSASGGSFIDLFNRLDMVNSPSIQQDPKERPTSSIYAHSRSNSFANSRKPSYTHSRNASTSRTAHANYANPNSKSGSRRGSMMSSFKALNEIGLNQQGNHINNTNNSSVLSTPASEKKGFFSGLQRNDKNGTNSDYDFFDSYADGYDEDDTENISGTPAKSNKSFKRRSDATATESTAQYKTPMSNGTHLSTIVSGKSRSHLSLASSSLPKNPRSTSDTISAAQAAAAAAIKNSEKTERTTSSGNKTDNDASGNQTTVPLTSMSKPELQHAFSSSNAINTKKKLKKKNTSAFQEGIKTITVQESMKDATCFGWMSKKGAGTVGVWKNRFFILHGTRLSYFQNTTATKERGLIDITAHKVLPARDDDKLVSLYAASTGKGRYCFKVVPPAPGSKKGLTFTQQRVHYFAVESKEEMRQWMAALIKATIDIDSSVPIISSCATPTISLTKAQEMLDQARRETQQREKERQERLENGEISQADMSNDWEMQQRYITPEANNSKNQSKTEQQGFSPSSGFASPYLLASGVFARNSVQSPGTENIDENVESNFAFGGVETQEKSYASPKVAQIPEYQYTTRLDPKYGKKL